MSFEGKSHRKLANGQNIEDSEKRKWPKGLSAPALELNTIIFKHVYWYMQLISGERLQDHWSSGLFLFQYLSIFQFSYSDEHEKITSGVCEKLQTRFSSHMAHQFSFYCSNEETTKPSNNSDKKTDSTEQCSRTFITFTDERNFKEYFPNKKHRPPVKQFCPVTRLPAKYFDPITNTPYATIQAFKIIREAYAQQLQTESVKRSRSGTPDTSQAEVSVTS